MSYVVTCLDDKGSRILATRQCFNTWMRAKQYASSVAISREPQIVSGAFDSLRPQRDEAGDHMQEERGGHGT